jgi:acetyl-CoA synthetase
MFVFFLIMVIMSASANGEQNAYIPSQEIYRDFWNESVVNFEKFWDGQAQEIPWISPYSTVWERPHGEEDAFVGKWFAQGKLNVASICVDRWASKHGDETALIWIGEADTENSPLTRTYTYQDLSVAVNQAANLLKEQGVCKGDRVGIWMPMTPELPITQLACAKIGAVSVVVFTGFSAANAEDRFSNACCKVIVTADGGTRGGKPFALRSTLSHAFIQQDFLKRIITYSYLSLPYTHSKKDISWNSQIGLMSAECAPEPMDSEDPLFLLYTSGTTGKPKGIVHTTAGYLLYSITTMKYVWGIHGFLFPEETKNREIWFCTADIGWITGHSYITYAPFALGSVVVMCEGLLTYPTPEKLYSLIDRYKVSHLYTSPTLLRQLASYEDSLLLKYPMDSLRVLGSVGEPILPKTWHWYHEKIGKSRCPIVDTYWQTESGGYLLSPIAGATILRPGSSSFPFLSILPKILREDGSEAATGEKGVLCISQPWPGMLRTVYGNHNRFLKEYLGQFPGHYCTGDEAYKDEEGYIWILGRTDDVIKVAGHRLGTAELEAVIATFPGVIEAAVTTIPDTIKDNAIIVFAVGKEPISSRDLQNHLRTAYGPIAVPEKIVFVSDLPKTRSGKIVRRLLRNLYLGKDVGDTSTLINPDVIEGITAAIRQQ